MTHSPQYPIHVLEFNGTPIEVLDRHGQKWLTAEQLGVALGYTDDNARDGVLRLFNRHRDEFTEEDSCKVKLTAQGQQREMRIFSVSGCNLLSFFSNTPRAKHFRAWAKQVLAQTRQASVLPRKSGRLLVTRRMEREVLELFVQGYSQADISRQVRVSTSTINLLLHAKYQFSEAAGAPECTDALLTAVAHRHLALEQERLLAQQQRIAQRYLHSANNQGLAQQLERVGQHLKQPLPQALLPLDAQGGDQ